MGKLIISEALEVLIDEYEKSKKNAIEKKKKTKDKTSSIQYKNNVINAFDFGIRENEFTSNSEKDFLSILPKLIADDRKEDINNLISLIRRSVCLYNWGSNKRSYKTYIIGFVNFIETLNNSNAKNLKTIVEKIKEKKPDSLSEEEKEELNEALSQNEVFNHKRLVTKFKSRLRGQERTSGDKIWLPLDFIAKIYRKNDKSNNSPFSQWLDSLVDSIYIHYEDNKGQIKSVQFKKKEIHLEFLKNEKEEDSFDVYIIWSRKGRKRRVFTPTGKGNEKIPMTVKSISEIDIDHVKPIDLTLKQLGEKNKINTLKLVSDTYKQLSNDISNDNKQDIENKTNCAIETLLNDESFSIESLTKDLKRIRKDTILRLMDSKYNENKSNGLTYEAILMNGQRYIGILGHVDEDDNGLKLTIYQNLDENGYTRATVNILPGEEIDICKKLIDYL